MLNKIISLKYAYASFVLAWFTIGWIELSAKCNPPNYPDGNSCLLLKWAYDWQQLLGGLLALVAAFIGAHFIRAQTQLADEHERERIRRRHAAARAAFALTLSSVGRYAQQCAVLLTTIHERRTQTPVISSLELLANLRPPPLHGEIVGEFKEMVEASDPSIGRSIADLLSTLQVQVARLETMFERSTGRITTLQNIEGRIGDLIDLKARSDALFNYARGHSDVPPSEPLTRSFERIIKERAEANCAINLGQSCIAALKQLAEPLS